MGWEDWGRTKFVAGAPPAANQPPLYRPMGGMNPMTMRPNMPGAQFNFTPDRAGEWLRGALGNQVIPGVPFGGLTPNVIAGAMRGQGDGDGILGKIGGWLGRDDNAIQLAGLGLGAYGAYKQGRAQDKQTEEEQRRHDDEKRRREESARMLEPLIAALMQRTMKGMGEGG